MRESIRKGPGKATIGAVVALAVVLTACAGNRAVGVESVPVDGPENGTEPTPEHSFAQKELVDGTNSTSRSPIGQFDFKNYSYPLPRGWHDSDSREITLTDGKRRTTEQKIGMEFLTTKFFDLTQNGEDEAAVILQIRTGGSAVPQIVYIFEWREGAPNLIWYFRTGDRADGGLKKIYAEDNALIVELFGRDRYIFGQMETLKITGDEFQLCCPTHFTKTRYVRSGRSFSIDGDRMTHSIADPSAEPVRNMGDLALKEERESEQ